MVKKTDGIPWLLAIPLIPLMLGGFLSTMRPYINGRLGKKTWLLKSVPRWAHRLICSMVRFQCIRAIVKMPYSLIKLMLHIHYKLVLNMDLMVYAILEWAGMVLLQEESLMLGPLMPREQPSLETWEQPICILAMAQLVVVRLIVEAFLLPRADGNLTLMVRPHYQIQFILERKSCS
jgi:hypothetical protein